MYLSKSMHKSVYYVGTYLGRVSQCVIISYIFESVFIPPLSLSFFLSSSLDFLNHWVCLSLSLSHSFVSGFHGQLWWKFAPLMREEKEETSWTKNMGRRLFKLLLWRRSPHPLLTCLPTSSPPSLIPHPTDDVDNLKAKFRLGGESVVQWIPRAEVLLECDFSTTWPQLWYPSGLRFETIKPKNKVIWLCLVCWHVMVILFVLIT